MHCSVLCMTLTFGWGSNDDGVVYRCRELDSSLKFLKMTAMLNLGLIAILSNSVPMLNLNQPLLK